MGRRGNGEGSISRRKDGRWEAKYTAHTADGPKRRALYGKTRKEAADKLAKALADRVSGYTFDTENMSVGEYLDRWLNDSGRGSVRLSTYERHEQIVRLHLKPALGRVKLTKLTPAHVQGLYPDKLDSGLTPATVQKIHTVLHKALAQALKWEDVELNEGVICIKRTLVRSGRRIAVGEPKTKGSRRPVHLTGTAVEP